MTLMEVILAIAILGGCLAVLGEMVRVGARASRAARILSTAQLLADSLAADITAGAAAPESTNGIIEQFGGTSWAYSVQVEQVQQEGLLGIVITVRDNLDQSGRPTTCSIIRWMIDPQIEYDLENAAAEAEAASGSTDTSGGADSGSGAAGGDAAAGGGR